MAYYINVCTVDSLSAPRNEEPTAVPNANPKTNGAAGDVKDEDEDSLSGGNDNDGEGELTGDTFVCSLHLVGSSAIQC